MRLIHAAIAAALGMGLAAPVFADEEAAAARYAIDVAVMRTGVEIAAGRAAIREGGQAEIMLTGADGQYLFTADLQAAHEQDGDDRLLLEAHLNHDGVDMASPRLLVNRGGRALMQIGSKNEDAERLSDGIEISLTPLL